jgi:fructose-specific phosphotransferase system IIC component
MGRLINKNKGYLYKASSVAFLFQLFGALGAGILFFVGDLLGIHILSPDNGFSNILWQIFFWATDFFFVGFTVYLAYLIAGVAAIAPSLTLSVYFAHFAGLYGGESLSLPMYADYFTTPSTLSVGGNIGYMGYLIIGLLVGWLVKLLFTAWSKLKRAGAKKIDSPVKKLGQKIKLLGSLDGMGVMSLLDLIVLILILPVVSGIITFFAVRFGIELPFKALADSLRPVLSRLFAQSRNFEGGLLLGAMAGFDIIGPLSRTAFSMAAVFAENMNGIPMTAYSLAIGIVGWVPFILFLLAKITKSGIKTDGTDGAIAPSGPINAFFDNMKLTAAFAMTSAYRRPLSCIVSYVISCAAAGALSCTAGLTVPLYTSAENVSLYKQGEMYVSILQPYKAAFKMEKGLLFLVIAAISVLLGSLIGHALQRLSLKLEKKRGEAFVPDTDITLELVKQMDSYNKKLQAEAVQSDDETQTLAAER